MLANQVCSTHCSENRKFEQARRPARCVNRLDKVYCAYHQTKHFQTMYWGDKKEIKMVDCPGLVCPSLVGLEMQVSFFDLLGCQLTSGAGRQYVERHSCHVKLTASPADLANPFIASVHSPHGPDPPSRGDLPHPGARGGTRG